VHEAAVYSLGWSSRCLSPPSRIVVSGLRDRRAARGLGEEDAIDCGRERASLMFSAPKCGYWLAGRSSYGPCSALSTGLASKLGEKCPWFRTRQASNNEKGRRRCLISTALVQGILSESLWSKTSAGIVVVRALFLLSLLRKSTSSSHAMQDTIMTLSSFLKRQSHRPGTL